MPWRSARRSTLYSDLAELELRHLTPGVPPETVGLSGQVSATKISTIQSFHRRLFGWWSHYRSVRKAATGCLFGSRSLEAERQG